MPHKWVTYALFPTDRRAANFIKFADPKFLPLVGNPSSSDCNIGLRTSKSAIRAIRAQFFNQQSESIVDFFPDPKCTN